MLEMSEVVKEAKPKRELAWLLLKQTRNPEYVALRYGYNVETMREALKKIPAPPDGHLPGLGVGYNSNGTRYKSGKRLADHMPKIDREKPEVEREPGSDDELGE